jgi:hypothetical protein
MEEKDMRWVVLVSSMVQSITSLCASTVDMSGTWGFALDRQDAGQTEAWYKKKDFTDTIRLPGSLQEQGYGDKPSAKTVWKTGDNYKNLLDTPRFSEYIHAEDYKSPFWLTPNRHYVGAAWYQRRICVPRDWQGKRITLTLERPHWETTVWIDQSRIGTQDGLGIAHIYDLTSTIKPGQTQRLTIRIDNRIIVPVGDNAHSVSDQTQSSWNGIAGQINLDAGPLIWLENIKIVPDVKNRRIHITGELGNISGHSGKGTLTIQADNPLHQTAIQTTEVPWTQGGGKFDIIHEMGSGCLLWDEYQPNIYNLQLTFNETSYKFPFGMREFSVDGTQFAINGRRVFLRGTLDCCIYPEHGYPPMDVAQWKRILGTARQWGLNHIRFHSWCPPEAAFEAADEMGFYFLPEASCWAHFGDGTKVDTWIYQEMDRMLAVYGNHPSFVMFTPTTEAFGENREAFLGKLITHYRARDSQRMYTAGAGWPSIPQNQYHILMDVRLQNFVSKAAQQTTFDYSELVKKYGIPLLGHEVGQWCAYPDLHEDALYTGVLKAKYIAIFRDKLNKAGMAHLSEDFLWASGKFQVLLYRQEIETALRTPGFAGFDLLGLSDFPGQGTAPVGVLNALGQPKGYVTADEYRRFCNDVVPLARMDRLVFTNDQTLHAEIQLANYSAKNMDNVICLWTLRKSNGRILKSGELKIDCAKTGGLSSLGTVDVPLVSIQKAQKLSLEVRVSGTAYANDWDIWVYPRTLPACSHDSVRILRDPAKAWNALEEGKNVLLLADAKDISGDTVGTFQPILWNRITFPEQKVHTTGILCDPEHPALADFPTDCHSSWQWQDLLDDAKPIILNTLPSNLWPIVQPIDDWNNPRKLAVLFEVKADGGKLMICSMDLHEQLEHRPVARQLRESLLNYMESTAFNPVVVLERSQYQALFNKVSFDDQAAK